MKMFKYFFSLILLLELIHPVFAQTEQSKDDLDLEDDFTKIESKIPNQKKALSLLEAISLGLRAEVNERSRKFKRVKFDLAYDDAFEKFWLPDTSLSLTTNKHPLHTFQENQDASANTPLNPDGTLSLNLGEYSVFNWGRDYLEYVNAQKTYSRNKQQLYEQRRKLKFDIIYQYFFAAIQKISLRVYKDQLRHTSFVHRLAKEKVQLKKIKPQEFFQTKNEFLRTQAEYQNALIDSITADQKLADLLGDELDTSYRIINQLKFKKINLNSNRVFKESLKANPNLLDKILNMENSNRTYQRVVKENLPLPKIGLNFGVHSHNFSNSSVNNSFQTDTNNKNVELTAQINMTWSIFGEGGFFNTRTRQQAYLDKRIAEIEFFDAKRALRLEIRSLVSSAKKLENAIQYAELKLKNSRVVFDSAFDNYISSKTTFLDLKLAIDELTASEIDYEIKKINHLKIKLNLAYLMGRDDLPGDNFERLILQ